MVLATAGMLQHNHSKSVAAKGVILRSSLHLPATKAVRYCLALWFCTGVGPFFRARFFYSEKVKVFKAY